MSSERAAEARLKILTHDRKSFMKICKVFGLADTDLVFESATLNGAPVDLDDLVANHVGIIQRNQQISHFLSQILAAIYGPDIPPTIDDLLRAGNMDKILLKLRENQIVTPTKSVPEAPSQSVGVNTNFSDIDQIVQTESVLSPRGSERTQAEVDLLRSQVGEFQRELVEAQILLNSKDEEISNLKQQIDYLKDRSCQLELFEDLALRQAARDAEVSLLRQQLAGLGTNDTHDDLDASIFRKNIFIKVLTYSLTGEYGNLAHMVPIIRTVFELDDDEATELSKLCESLKQQSILSSILPYWR